MSWILSLCGLIAFLEQQWDGKGKMKDCSETAKPAHR